MVLGGIIYLYDISMRRYPVTGTAHEHLQRFNMMYRPATLDKVVLCTAHWGQVPSEELEEDRREVKLQNLHWKSMVEQGSKVRRFTRDQDSARDILSLFLPQAACYSGNSSTRQIKEVKASEGLSLTQMSPAFSSLGVKNGDRMVPDVNATGAGRSSKRTHKTNSQDKILENGKETDIVIPFVITSYFIMIPTKTYHSIMGATGAGKSSVSEILPFYLISSFTEDRK